MSIKEKGNAGSIRRWMGAIVFASATWPRRSPGFAQEGVRPVSSTDRTTRA